MTPSPDRDSPSPLLSSSSGGLVLPRTEATPLRAVLVRVLVGIGVLVAVAFVVWLDRDGYTDVDDDVSFRDALYYATVSLSTTGYGDIAPATDQSRLVNILLITPLRVLFVLVLVGTTVEVLTRRSRNEFRLGRWRAALSGHVVIVGYGTKGRAAARALLDSGQHRSGIVVVEGDPEHQKTALRDRLAVVAGDGTRQDVLSQAGIEDASRVVVALDEDASAVLATLTARRLNPNARLVAAVREGDNAQVLHDSGASSVVLSSEAAGRLLGMSVTSPTTGRVLEHLMTPGAGLDLQERPVRPDEVGRRAQDTGDMVVAVVRDGQRLMGGDRHTELRDGDLLVVVADGRQPG